MAGSQRVYRQRIRSTQSLKKIFRAWELIAASRIGKARDRVDQTVPYARALTQAVSSAASHVDLSHPLVSERQDTNRVALLVITADRGMAGSYTAAVIREGERLREKLIEQGKDVQLYVMGRRGLSFYNFRGREVVRSWTGGSDSPTVEIAHEVADTLLDAFLADLADGGVSELHIVHTQFVNMVTQVPRVVRLLPLVVVDADEEQEADLDAYPLYEFEPSAAEVLDALLPRYVRSRVLALLVQSAAAELAARQSAMHTAVENADELIRDYTRLANQARQAEITQEISEIVSGADALAAS